MIWYWAAYSYDWYSFRCLTLCVVNNYFMCHLINRILCYTFSVEFASIFFTCIPATANVTTQYKLNVSDLSKKMLCIVKVLNVAFRLFFFWTFLEFSLYDGRAPKTVHFNFPKIYCLKFSSLNEKSSRSVTYAHEKFFASVHLIKTIFCKKKNCYL